MYNCVVGMQVELAALSEAVKVLATAKGADPDAIAKKVDEAVTARLKKLKLSVTV
jgi:hypothetical protein